MTPLSPEVAVALPTLSSSLQILLLMSALTLLPAALLMMTCFTRVIVVLAILRQALGLGQSPPNQLLVGMALLMTVFVMKPSLDRIYDGAGLHHEHRHQQRHADEQLVRRALPQP